MSDMLKVVKGNVEYRIPAHKKKEYLEQGYSVLDGHGNVVIEGRPVTIVDHKQRIADLEKQLAAKTEEADKLNAEIAEKDKIITLLNERLERADLSEAKADSKKAKAAAKTE